MVVYTQISHFAITTKLTGFVAERYIYITCGALDASPGQLRKVGPECQDPFTRHTRLRRVLHIPSFSQNQPLDDNDAS